ncbi:MAG: hypothetical protein MOGMAGMI_02236 [Candidatus Omnitrophica bacterium]|nr:hypothetical protein [Candidatus Omnitrophota bacterium]
MASAPASAEGPSRALFVSVLTAPAVFESRQAMDELVRFSSDSGVTILYVQVYRSGRSWVPTSSGDTAPYEQCRAALGEDPLAYLIRAAQSRGIEVHAWINLLSLGANNDAPILKRYGAGVLTRNTSIKWGLESYKVDKQFFLEPGDPRVREWLGQLVEDVARTYPELDGIQYDYIRYPDTEPSYGHTAENLRRFRDQAGRAPKGEQDPEWREWKRQQVTSLVRELTERVHAVRPALKVSTTGLVPYSRALLESYQDWKDWIESGLVDHVTLMCYSSEPGKFEYYLEDAKRRLGSLERVHIAVGAYSAVERPEVFTRQWEQAEASGAAASAVLHYANLVERPELARPLLSRRKA